MPKRKEDAAATTSYHASSTTATTTGPHNNKDTSHHHIDLDALPIPIQNFLWCQLSPFVRPYNRRLQDISCSTWERVVVQNILHGLSPSLSDAISSIPRWRFIVATLPYVMHCCASTLDIKCRRSIPDHSLTSTSTPADHHVPLGPNSTKLLYTLHWILLDAAGECTPAADAGPDKHSLDPFLFPLTSLQVFVYLFAPLLPHLRPSDFTTFRLENGLKIWQPLWEYRQPDIPCFNAPAKPTPSMTDTQTELEQQLLQVSGLNVGDIYVGVQQDEGFLLAEPERNVEEAAAATEALQRARAAPHMTAPLAHMSEICTLTTLDTPLTLTPNLEYLCELCNTKVQADAKNVLRCKCGHHRRPRSSPANQQISGLFSSATSALAQQASLAASVFFNGAAAAEPLAQSTASLRSQYSPVDKEFLHNKMEMSIPSDGGRAQSLRDVSAATLFDVAVLRCLHVPPWSEEGLFWAVRYFFNRLIEIRDYLQRTGGIRQRSNSVPSCSKQQDEAAGPAKSTSSTMSRPANKLTPTSRREHLLSPLERGGSKRRRIAQASNSLDDAYKPKFFLGGEKLSSGRNDADISPANSPIPNRMQDVMFTFGDEEALLASPTLSRTGPTSNPVTPRERNMMRRSGKSFPRITITTENSPSGAVNAGEEEMEGIGLTRSKTDSSIAYPLAEFQEARGASNLINEDGQLNYQALVRAILVALNERPSQRICDVALSLLDVLLDLILDVRPVLPHDSSPAPTPLPPTPMANLPPLPSLDGIIYRLLLSCITRIFVVIGCPYGCGKESPPSRSNPAEYLRRQAYLFFHRLQTLNEPEARKYFKTMFSTQELGLVVEFCHAFFGSCVSAAAQDHSRTSKQLKKTLSWVALQATKPIISKLMDQLDVIKRPENMGLQNDLRSFLTYIKEAYEDVFRRVVMSGVMESQQRPPSSIIIMKSRPDSPSTFHLQLNQNSTNTTNRRKALLRHSRLESGGDREELLPLDGNQSEGDNLSSFEENNTPSAGYLRGIFAGKKARSHMKGLRDRDTSETNLKMLVLKSPRVSLSEDESSMPTGSPADRQKKLGLGLRKRWLKSPKSSLGSRDSRRGTFETSMSLTGSAEGSSEQSRQQSVESGNPGGAAGGGKPKLSFNATGHINLGVLRTKRPNDNFSREDDLRGVLRRNGTSKSEEVPLSNCTSFLLNVKALTSGMRCLGGLLEFCPPGTLPEPSVLTAMLDLQAPILARAAFFFECAQFVHRCNQGRWPDWMKLTSSQYRQSGPISRLIAAAPRKQNILQRTAGKVFYEWARSLTLRLEDILRAEHVDPTAVVSPTFIPEEEDYFLVGGDNLEPGNCPFALKLAACQLLLEITAFLRETYRSLPRREKYGTMRTSQGRGPAGDKRLASRRWSSVASTSGGASHQSIQSFVEHGQIHTIAGGHGTGERRISFMIADDSQSQKSNSSVAEEEEKRSHLLKSGRDRAKHHQHEGANGRRYSVRIRKTSHSEDSRRRADSIRSRKASSVSGRSDISQTSSTEDGTSPHYDDSARDREVFGIDQETTEYSDKMPWLESIITLCTRFSFICDHKKSCTLYCFYRIMRSCGRLSWSMRKLNGDNVVDGHKSMALEDDEVLEVTQGPSGTQTPTTPSSHRKLKIFRKASHYAGINRLSKTASLMEKNGSVETVNKMADGSGAAGGVGLTSKSDEDTNYYPQNSEKASVMAKYIRQQVISLFAAPFAAMAKGLLIMDEKQLERLFPVCWELLLVDDEEVASLTATLCVVCAVKISKFVVDFIRREMNHEESEERVDSVLKFQALWRYRYQVWIRLEDGAQGLLRVSQALNIDYTLPSPLIGRPTVDCPDAPWLPPTSIKIEEVAISQEEQSKNSNTLVAATQTRRKQLQESMSKAIRAQEERTQRERERTRITMLPVLRMASIEPVPPQVMEDREEGDDGGTVAETSTVATHTLTVQPVFPGSLAVAALTLIDLLDDADVDSCGICVSDLAFHTLWEGIIEDASLFLRHILEKVSNKDKQNFILRKLRRLMGHMPRLPHQAAATLFNHLMGYCMSYVRSPNENNLNGVESVMSVLWHIVPSVEGISFRDIKAVLRREQCDAHLLLTANVPGAKKVVVHGPDLTSIPSQLPVQEDTQFEELLTESLDFFGIAEADRKGYILTDSKTGRAHHPNGFVRDVYFFRRSFYPQLNLVRLPERDAFTKLQFQACHNLFLEAQKVFLVSSLFENALLKSDSALQQQQAMLLEDGLTKIPNFPRKALECDVKFQDGQFGCEYLGIDVMHKYSWIQMTASLLTTLSKSTAEVQLSHTDVLMLLSVLNGVLLLHCQDSAILRLSLSTFITVARNMKSLFATTGFLFIMPTLLEIYATHQANTIITEAIEFTCSQLFILHRNPFLLQLFGSAAGLLELSLNDNDQAKPLKRSQIKKILFSLEKYGRRQSKALLAPLRPDTNQAYHPLDYLDVLELVDSKKALQPLDLCYQNDMYDFTPSSILTSAVSSCIAVIAFDTAESPRGTQMLQVLRTLIHEEVWYDEKPADNAKSAKEELQKIIALAGSLKSLIFSCDSLIRPFTVPQRSANISSEATRQLGSLAPSFVPVQRRDVDVEANRPRITVQETIIDTDSQWEFSSPRNHLLAIIAHFLTTASSRIHHLSKFLGELSNRPPDLIDSKSHVRLSDIAQTLLKVAPYDQEVMACEGLQLYMTEILPSVDFSVESLKQTLQQLLRRVDKTFIKIMKKPNSKRDTNWTAAAKIIEGLTKTLCHNNLIALMPQLRSITGNCIHMTLSEPGTDSGSDLSLSVIPHSVLINTPVSILPVASVFRQATIDLCAVYLQAGKEYCNLEQLSAQFSDQLFRLVVCILLPLVLRLGSGGTSDLPALRIEDLRYIIRALIQLLHPPVTKQIQHHSTTGQSMKLTVTSNMTRTNSNMSNPPSGGADRSSAFAAVAAVNKQQDLSRRVAFLGLKIVIVCYEGRLGSEWLRLAKSIEDYGEKGNVGLAFWQFLEYTIVYRSALYVHLVAFAARITDISAKKETAIISEAEEEVQASIRRALSGNDAITHKSPELIFAQMSQEIQAALDEYILMSSTFQPSRSPTTIVAEEGSTGEPEGILRLADLARFRAHGRRKDSTQPTSSHHQADRSSSSGGGGGTTTYLSGKRSPPIIIPVMVERSENETKPAVIGVVSDHVLDRKRSTLMRQRAQYGLGEGQNQHHQHHPALHKKSNSSEIPEAMEMMQIIKATRDEHAANNVNKNINTNNNNSKIITVSVLNSRKHSKDKLMSVHRRHSIDSLNDDEEMSLLK